ncbi:MAG: dihydrolipoyl dehydrogenase [Pleomorphochaeta sp.]
MYDFDVISIGAGSGGCSSAMRASDLGKKVAVVEMRKNGIGGTCINRGCIPTKVFVKSASVLNQIKEAKNYGIVNEVEPIADISKIQKIKNKAVKNLRFGDTLLMKSRGIEQITGKAKFIDAHTIEVVDLKGEVKTYTSEYFVVATGSEPAMIPSFNINKKTIITSDEALELQELPKTMTVIGAGALGLEFAYIYASFGVKVTLCEMAEHVCPIMKEDVVTDSAEKYITKTLNIDLKLGNAIKEIIETEDGKTKCTLGNGDEIISDMTLVAIGRSLNTKDLGLDSIGVELSNRGLVVVDKYQKTNIDNIYAAGDITEGPQLSHKAQRQGAVAAENIVGQKSFANLSVIPWSMFMEPPISAVGISESQANEAGIETISGHMSFNANEKAMCIQETIGEIKLVFRKDNHEILGGQIFGPESDILIGEVAIALEKKLTADDIANSIHAHPTLNEIIMETAKTALGKAFHM